MRVIRPSSWLCASLVALTAFVWLGSISPAPLHWSEPTGWLDVVSLPDALVELARWLGLVLAAYIAIVALLVVLGELAVILRAVSVARLLHGVTSAIAVPALRRRLAGVSMSAVLTVSAGAASLGGRAFASAPVVQTVGAPSGIPARSTQSLLPAGVAASDVVGFGLAPDVESETASDVRVRVTKGDTVWDLAVAHYGFCTPAIVDAVSAASGVTDPALIFVGQPLVFPKLTSTSPPEASSSAVVVGSDVSAHAVVRGDTLWDLTRVRYGRVDAELVQAVAAFNGIEDASEIPIGVVLLLPPDDVLFGTALPPSDPPAVTADGTGSQTVVVDDVPPIVRGPVSEQAAPAVPPTPAAAVDPSASDGEVSREQAAIGAQIPSVTGHADADGLSVPWHLSLGGSATLAAALLGVYRTLRRRQRTAGASAWRASTRGQSEQAYRQLVAAADLSLRRWAGQELSGLLFDSGPFTARPVAVEVSQLFGIEVLWDAPMPAAPTPWEATPGGGWSWRLLYDPIAEVPAGVLPSAMPGLVTFGTRNDAQLLIDLESFGSVSIAGDQRACEDLLRSLVLELGAGEELSDARVFTVGLDVDGIEHLPRVQTRSEADVIAHARSVVADVRRVMVDAGVEDTFSLRTADAATAREATVVAVRAQTSSIVDELLALATPRSGVAIIILGPADEAGLDVVVDSDGSIQLASLGMTLAAASVTREASSNVAVLLDAAAASFLSEDEDLRTEEANEADDGNVAEVPSIVVTSPDGGALDELAPVCGSVDVDLVAAGALLDNPITPNDTEWTRPNPSLFVRVLGKPRVDGVPELTRYERMVVAYVASSGGEADDGPVRDAVWGGTLISDKRFWNVVAGLRSKIGPQACPSRTTGSPTVRLVDVMTDLQLFEVLAARASSTSSGEALELLTEALNMIAGEPYDDIGCEWAFDSQLTFKAAQAIESTALRAVELALTADDPAVARSAISQALLAMPGNEVLYRARMRVEAHLGNRAGVRDVYAELRAVLADLGSDCGDGGDPSPATRRLYEQLIGASQAN